MKRTKGECSMMISEDGGFSLVQVYLKPDVEQLSDKDLNNPGCTGQLKAQTV